MTDHIAGAGKMVMQDHAQGNLADDPLRIQRRRTRGWRMPPDTVCVCRPSRYGNWYHVIRTARGWKVCTATTFHGEFLAKKDASTEAVASYAGAIARNFVRYPSSTEKFVSALRGQNLACWCRLCPTHAPESRSRSSATPASRAMPIYWG